MKIREEVLAMGGDINGMKALPPATEAGYEEAKLPGRISQIENNLNSLDLSSDQLKYFSSILERAKSLISTQEGETKQAENIKKAESLIQKLEQVVERKNADLNTKETFTKENPYKENVLANLLEKKNPEDAEVFKKFLLRDFGFNNLTLEDLKTVTYPHSNETFYSSRVYEANAVKAADIITSLPSELVRLGPGVYADENKIYFIESTQSKPLEGIDSLTTQTFGNTMLCSADISEISSVSKALSVPLTQEDYEDSWKNPNPAKVDEWEAEYRRKVVAKTPRREPNS